MTDRARELVERLRDADANSVQRCLGSRIFAEAADFIEQSLTPPEGDTVSEGVDADVARRLASVANTLETCGKHGIPIDFAMLARDIRAALQSRVSPK
jgi:hypothetical protein